MSLLKLPLAILPCPKSDLLKKIAMIDFRCIRKAKKRKVNLRSTLDHYLEEDVMPDIAHFDILDFWKKDFKYPTLWMIASDILVTQNCNTFAI